MFIKETLVARGLTSWTSPSATYNTFLFDPEDLVLSFLEEDADPLTTLLSQSRCLLCTIGAMHEASCIAPGCQCDTTSYVDDAVDRAIADLMYVEGLPN